MFIGVGLVWKEVERRSIYSLLAKPIRRGDFILGKYLGLVLTLAVNVAIMAVGPVRRAGLRWHGKRRRNSHEAGTRPPPIPRCSTAIGLIFLQLTLVTAIALFFSTFSSPLLSAALTFGLFVIGHFNADLRNFEQVVESAPVAWLARALYYLLPNLAPFDVKAQVVHGLAVTPGFVRVDGGVRGRLHRRSAGRRDVDLRRGRTSSRAEGGTVRRTGVPWRTARQEEPDVA